MITSNKRRYKIPRAKSSRVRELEESREFGRPAFQPGQVIVVEVLFSDFSGAKRRPAVVVSPPQFHQSLQDLLVCPISSQPHYFARPGIGDVPLSSWRSIGLHHPSTARVSKLLAVDKKKIKRTMGQVSPGDFQLLSATLKVAVGAS